LLVEGSKEILKVLGYNAKLTQKDITFTWEPKKPQKTQYDVKKLEFEEKHFLVGSDFFNIHDDGETSYMKESDMKVKFANWIITYEDNEKILKKPFLKMWMEDENRKYYDKVNFIPDVSKCPPSIYNLFTGFYAETFMPKEEMNEEEIEILIKPILDHLDLLTSGYGYYICKWMANIIQTPHIKSEIAPVIRDQDELLSYGGGTGKNLMFEWFGKEILGEKYIQVVGNNTELYGDFNSMYEGKFLIFVEEASGKDNHSNNDNLKSQITQKKRNINKKNKVQYTVDDYARYIFTSNNRNPLKPNRRFAIFDTNPEKKGDVFYFEQLTELLSRSDVKWAYYRYLKTLILIRILFNLKKIFRLPMRTFK
jgi:Family of unknown function (DUF5906)